MTPPSIPRTRKYTRIVYLLHPLNQTHTLALVEANAPIRSHTRQHRSILIIPQRMHRPPLMTLLTHDPIPHNALERRTLVTKHGRILRPSRDHAHRSTRSIGTRTPLLPRMRRQITTLDTSIPHYHLSRLRALHPIPHHDYPLAFRVPRDILDGAREQLYLDFGQVFLVIEGPDAEFAACVSGGDVGSGGVEFGGGYGGGVSAVDEAGGGGGAGWACFGW
mmetsp:Transcript_11295/g.20725  ORF Transcript_11295/g.20725 Transcript_11295/m.20725 type:complete len:220 (+) Transcript_11295:1274-1933(+)